MKLREDLKYPRDIVVTVADFAEESSLRKFCAHGARDVFLVESETDYPPAPGRAATSTDKSEDDDEKDPDDPDGQPDEGGEGKKPLGPQPAKWRNMVDDIKAIPSAITMRHCIMTTKEHGARTVTDAIFMIYGEPTGFNSKLYQAYKKVWLEIENGRD